MPPDNIPITLGSGASVATDQVGGLHYPYTKIASGVAGEENYLDIDAAGSAQTRIVGNVTVDQVDAVTNITNPIALKGNVTIDSVASNTAWSDPNTFIGLTTVVQSSTSRSIVGNVTVDQVDTVVAVTDITNPVALKGNVTLDDGSKVGLVGNVTVSMAGPAHTLVPHVIDLSDASIATVAVPTNTFKVTSLIVNSDATVRVSIKSGATYLTGNASIGITLNPGGGFIKDGSPDSPSLQGLADAEALVVEKFDMTGTSAKVSGSVLYFDE